MSRPLLPRPRRVAARGDALSLRAPVRVAAGGLSAPAIARIERSLAARGRFAADAERALPLRVAREAVEGGPEAYRLTLSSDGVDLAAATDAGLAHGASTLAQWTLGATERDGGLELPGVRIDDAPTLARRGAMLDVSRDRVPTMATLFALIERFASWKLNHLQLYTEHTFAYAGHEDVWRDASPLTPTEIRELDAFCAARGIELVPNQNCFGHMHRWLRHARYRPLAEVPDGVKHPFAVEPEPFSLCPLDPGSLALVEELLDQLLPCFASREVNVGLDETFDLGEGRSRDACAEKGVGRVYLEHLLAVHRLAAARGRRVQVWADILMHRPELVPELPRDVVAMLWGYDAGHPFEREAEIVAKSGLDFFVCPGTSSWQSFGGRTANMLANVAAAAREGAARGASGMLVTDWGDRGHLQPQAVSYAGWARAADLAWNASNADEREDDAAEHVAAQIDAHALDSAEGLGAAALGLGRVEEAMGTGATNGTAPFFLIAMVDEPVPSSRVTRIDPDAVERGRAVLERARAALVRALASSTESALARAELAHAADLIELGLDVGALRLEHGGDRPLASLPAAARAPLAARFEAALAAHAERWAARSRPGGRADSARWLARVRDLLCR